MRSFNRRLLTENNRVLADHVYGSLVRHDPYNDGEQYAEIPRPGRVSYVGNMIYGEVLSFRGIARKRSMLPDPLTLSPQSYMLATFHQGGKCSISFLLDGDGEATYPVTREGYPVRVGI